MRDLVVMDCEEQGNFWLTLETDHPVHFCTTAEEGLEKVSGNTGLVFVNLKLPDMNGMDVLKMIKGSRPSIPVIVITFCGAVDTCVEAFREGARDYLRKPLDAGEVLRKIGMLIHANEDSRRRRRISMTTEAAITEMIGGADYADIPTHLLAGVLKVRDFIVANYSESLTLHDACKMASISKTYFCHFFKRVTGHSLRNYQHAVKVRKAEEILRDKRLSITDVALELGYNDSNYFSTVYKKFTGASPKHRRTSGHEELPSGTTPPH